MDERLDPGPLARGGSHRVLEPIPPGGLAQGRTSGKRQWIRSAHYDCDGDTLLFKVEQEGGGSCHTGEYTCFHLVVACAHDHEGRIREPGQGVPGDPGPS